jgi:hypothetical protein
MKSSYKSTHVYIHATYTHTAKDTRQGGKRAKQKQNSPKEIVLNNNVLNANKNNARKLHRSDSILHRFLTNFQLVIYSCNIY